MQGYLERLITCGISYSDAVIIVSDFLQTLDWDGLDEYCRGTEAIYYKEY